MADNIAFKSWLVGTKGLSKNTADDNSSRVNRVLKLIQVSMKDTAIDIKYRLDKLEVFCALPPTVKSQLKHAAVLYLEWLNVTASPTLDIDAELTTPPPREDK